MDFRISQGSVATYWKWGGNLCGVYIENFLTNQLAKEFWKLVPGPHLPKLLSNIKWDTFLRQSVQGAAKTIMLSFHDYEKFIHQVERQIIHDCYIHIKTQVPSEMLQFLSYWVFFLPTHCTTYSYLWIFLTILTISNNKSSNVIETAVIKFTDRDEDRSLGQTLLGEELTLFLG